MPEQATAEAGQQTFAEFEKLRSEGKSPVPQTEEVKPPEPEKKEEQGSPVTPPKEEEGKKEAGETGTPETHKEDEPQEGEEPRWYQKRIARFTRLKYEQKAEIDTLKARLAELETVRTADANQATAVPAKDDEPKPESFETTEAYIKALASWQYRKDKEADEKAQAERRARDEEKNLIDGWNKRTEAARKVHDDFDSVLDQEIPIPLGVQRALFESENGAEVAYWLGKNPAEAERISKLPLLSAVRELGKIEVKLAAKAEEPPPKPPKPEVTAAPPPPVVVGAKAPPSTNPQEATSFSEYEKRRKAQLKK